MIISRLLYIKELSLTAYLYSMKLKHIRVQNIEYRSFKETADNDEIIDHWQKFSALRRIYYRPNQN